MSSLVQRVVGLFDLTGATFSDKSLLLNGLQELQDFYYKGRQGVQTPMTAEDFDALTQAITQGEKNKEADAQSIFPMGSRMCPAQINNIAETLFVKYNRGNVSYVRPGLRRKASAAGPAPAAPKKTEDIDMVIKDLEDGLQAARQARIEADQKAVDALAHEGKLHTELEKALERKRKREEGQ